MLSHEQLIDADRTRVWHGFTQMAEYEPLIIERASGCTLFDIDGKQYIDAVSSIWCNVHGHGHPVLDAALREQLERVAHTTLLGAGNRPAIELAARLVKIVPPGLNHVYYSDNGSTAVEAALKIAIQYWQQCPNPQPNKNKFVALDRAYHGDTIGSVSTGGIELFHKIFRPLLFEVIRLPAADSYRLPNGVNVDGVCEHYLGQLERTLKEHQQQVAALIIEPLVQGAAGLIFHPPGFLQGVRELTRRYNVLLIADEVAVGFGRTGRMFACEHEDVSPDLMCLSKGISGGYLPLGATLATDEIWQAFLGNYEDARTFFHGHTYAGNPLACAVGLASLDVFEEERTLEKMQAKVEHLAGRLKPLADLPYVGDVRQRGLIAAVELVKDRDSKEPFDWAEQRGMRVCQIAREHGVLCRPLGNVVVIMPPLAITLGELDRIVDAIEVGIRQSFADE